MTQKANWSREGTISLQYAAGLLAMFVGLAFSAFGERGEAGDSFGLMMLVLGIALVVREFSNIGGGGA